MAIRTLRRAASTAQDANQPAPVAETPVAEEAVQSTPAAGAVTPQPAPTEVPDTEAVAQPAPKAKKKAPAKKAAKKEPAEPKPATVNTLTFEEAAFKENFNMTDFVNLLFTHLNEEEVVTKKVIEEFASVFFMDLIPTLLDNKSAVSLGAIRIGYTDVKQRLFKANDKLNAKEPFDTLIQPHTVARFKREIGKVALRGQASEDKKTFLTESGETITLD